MWEIDPETGEEYWVDLPSDDPAYTPPPWMPETTPPGDWSHLPPGAISPEESATGLNDFWKTLTPQKIIDLLGPIGKTIGSAGIASLLNNVISGGPKVPRAYPGGIPNLVANREQLAQPAQGRRPGSGGVTYFSPMTYSKAPTPAADPTGTIKNYIQSLAWGNPEADAIATPQLMAEMTRRGWSMDQLAKASGFSAEALQAMFDKYGTATPPASVQDARSAAAPAPAPAPAPAALPAGSSPFVVGGTPVGTYAPAPPPADTAADARLRSIATFLNTNPTQQALAAAMQQYGVNQTDVDRARSLYGSGSGASSWGNFSAAQAAADYQKGAAFGGTPTQTTAAASTPYAIDANPSVWDLVSQVSQQANYQRDPNVAANAANPYRQANEINLDTMQYYFPELNQGKNAQAEYNAAMAASQGGGPGAVFGGSPTRLAQGGIATLGYAKGRLLNGPGDGVSDSIPATINGTHPAALADGEYVIPARIVSELGNGSTKAGAQKLDAMMKRIQASRRKATDIAANTRVDKHLPA